MNKSRLFFLLPLLLAGCHPPDSMRDDFASGHPAVLDRVTPGADGVVEFRFHSGDGNVVVLHRQGLGNTDLRAPSDVSIDTEPAQQRAGASFTDSWSCQGETGRVAIRAYLIDANHHHSDPVDYTVDCGG